MQASSSGKRLRQAINLPTTYFHYIVHPMADRTLNLILSPGTFYVLLALATKTLHGYGIRDQIIHDSEGSLIIATGTLYPLLNRLTDARLIERVAATDPGITHRYRITTTGRHRLEADI